MVGSTDAAEDAPVGNAIAAITLPAAGACRTRT